MTDLEAEVKDTEESLNRCENNTTGPLLAEKKNRDGFTLAGPS